MLLLRFSTLLSKKLIRGVWFLYRYNWQYSHKVLWCCFFFRLFFSFCKINQRNYVELETLLLLFFFLFNVSRITCYSVNEICSPINASYSLIAFGSFNSDGKFYGLVILHRKRGHASTPFAVEAHLNGNLQETINLDKLIELLLLWNKFSFSSGISTEANGKIQRKKNTGRFQCTAHWKW